MAAPTWVADASVTKDNSAPGAGCAKTAEEERARLAAEKASLIAADHTNDVDPLGPPRSALVRGWTILAAAGMNRL
jgi:hypothetical protein